MLGMLLGIVVFVADIWAIVKTFQSSVSTAQKFFWAVLIILLPVLGLIVWFIAGPRRA